MVRINLKLFYRHNLLEWKQDVAPPLNYISGSATLSVVNSDKVNVFFFIKKKKKKKFVYAIVFYYFYNLTR